MRPQGAAGTPALAHDANSTTKIVRPRHATSVGPSNHITAINSSHMRDELAGSDLTEVGERIALVAGSVLARNTKAAPHESLLYLGQAHKLSHCPRSAIKRKFRNGLHARQAVSVAAKPNGRDEEAVPITTTLLTTHRGSVGGLRAERHKPYSPPAPALPGEHAGGTKEHQGAPRSTREHQGAPRERMGVRAITDTHRFPLRPRKADAGGTHSFYPYGGICYIRNYLA